MQLDNGERYHYETPKDPFGVNTPLADASRGVQIACKLFAPKLEVLACGEVGDTFVFLLHEYIPPTPHEHTFTLRCVSQIEDRGEAFETVFEALAGYDIQAYEVR
jgi:hypothetical protein